MVSSSISPSSPTANSTTAFGELAVQQIIPQVQIHFPYNLNTEIINTTTSGSGSVTHSGQFAVISSGAATSSGSALFSNRYLEYHPGIGALCRFTAIFDTAVSGNTQIAGCGNATDGFFFGYNGTTFGILRRSGSSDNWIAQTSWNIDKMDGTGPSKMTLDTTKGNVFQIQFQWLGFGSITFSLENQYSGQLIPVHRISYSNQNTSTSINNPSLPFQAESLNTTNNTDIQLKVPSIGMFIQGQISTTSFTRHAINKERS